MPSNIEKCYQCGQCTSVCPMAEQEQTYKIRRFLQLEKIKYENEGLSSLPAIFYCTTCYKCQDNCPQGVKIVDAVLEIRVNAVHKGDLLPAHRKVSQMLIKTGHAVPPNEENRKKRVKLGLSDFPSTVASYPEKLQETQKLLSLCSFDDLIKDKAKEESISVNSQFSAHNIEEHA